MRNIFVKTLQALLGLGILIALPFLVGLLIGGAVSLFMVGFNLLS